MHMEDQIRQALESAFSPVHLEIINESDNHIGHAGHDGSGESHFKLIVVSKVFTEYNRVQRHQLAYAALSALFPSKIHALSMMLFTEFEYKSL